MSINRNLSRIAKLGAISVETVDDLIELDILTNNKPSAVIVLGRNKKKDGGESVWFWDETSLEEHNGFDVVMPNGIVDPLVPGRWIVLNRFSSNEVPFNLTIKEWGIQKNQNSFDIEFTPGRLFVFINGLIQPSTSFTEFTEEVEGETVGKSFKLNDRVKNNETTVVAYGYANVKSGMTEINTIEVTAAAGADTFSIDYDADQVLFVYVNGILLDKTDYTATTGTEFVLTKPIVDDDSIVQAIGYEIINLGYLTLDVGYWENVRGLKNIEFDHQVSGLGVYLNGVLLSGNDYTAKDGKFIELKEGMRFDSDFLRTVTFSYVDPLNKQLSEILKSIEDISFVGDVSELIAEELSGVKTDVDNVTTRLDALTSIGDGGDNSLVPLYADLGGLHADGGTFNFAQFQRQEFAQSMDAFSFEMYATLLRSLGCSGILSTRGYNKWGILPYNRSHDSVFAAITVHNHSDINPPLGSQGLSTEICGMAELQAVINGYFVQTRHLDYRIAKPIPTADKYLNVEPIPGPQVPPSVTAKSTVSEQVDEMREYFIALREHQRGLDTGGKGLSRKLDLRNYFNLNISYLECWFEEIGSGALNETSPSGRHSYAFRTLPDMLTANQIYNNSGLKNRFENTANLITPIRTVREDGTPIFSILTYRVVCADLGNMNNFDIAKCVVPIDSPPLRAGANRFGDNSVFFNARTQRFKVRESNSKDGDVTTNAKGLIDHMMEYAYGFDGPDGEIYESMPSQPKSTSITNPTGVYTETFEYGTLTKLNAAKYNRKYSFSAGAANRSNAMRGFNDQNLFVAKTTNDKVVGIPWVDKTGTKTDYHRYSYAIPLEIILRTPLLNWNPNELPKKTATTIGGKGTEEEPWDGYGSFNTPTGGAYYLTPASFYSDVDIPIWKQGDNYPRGSQVRDPNALTAGGDMLVFEALTQLFATPINPSEDSENWKAVADPADTSSAVRWVWEKGIVGGNKVKHVSSGTWVILPRIKSGGNEYDIRCRYPIYSTFAEGMQPNAEIAALRADLIAAGIDIPSWKVEDPWNPV